MSDQPDDIVLEDADDAAGSGSPASPPGPPPAPEPTPVVLAPPGQDSILGTLKAEIHSTAEDSDEFKILPVGKIHPRLYAQYKALVDDEIEDINRLAAGRERLRKRVGQDDPDLEGKNQRSALLLARACVMLFWRNDDGKQVPLHEALAAQGVEVDGPLRFDRRLIALFDLDGLPAEASGAQVAMRLHRWGQDNNYSPLRSTAQLVELHASGLSGEALEVALAGN